MVVLSDLLLSFLAVIISFVNKIIPISPSITVSGNVIIASMAPMSLVPTGLSITRQAIVNIIVAILFIFEFDACRSLYFLTAVKNSITIEMTTIVYSNNLAVNS